MKLLVAIIFAGATLAVAQPWAGVRVNAGAPVSQPFFTAQSLGASRTDGGVPFGFTFTAGQNSHITALGRWVASGDSQTHLLAICSTNCDILATVTVNCGGAPVGAYIYGTLAAPYALTAGATYIIFSQEASGEPFLNAGTVTWNSTEGNNVAAEFARGNLSSSINSCTATSPGDSFGPLNFLYTVP